MEITNNTLHPSINSEVAISNGALQSSDKAFIEANTIHSTLEELKNDHIIPVFIKDNTVLISHFDFVESTLELASQIIDSSATLRANIRVSHPVQGRVPSAKFKAANELLEGEKTLYFERLAFVIEIPSITDVIDGNLVRCRFLKPVFQHKTHSFGSSL